MRGNQPAYPVPGSGSPLVLNFQLSVIIIIYRCYIIEFFTFIHPHVCPDIQIVRFALDGAPLRLRDYTRVILMRQ